MKRKVCVGAGILLAVLLATLFPAHTGADTPAEKPLLVACYYVWYAAGDHPQRPWESWTSEGATANVRAKAAQRPGEPPMASADYPLIGPYDSADTEVAEWHVQLAQAAGIDAFLVSWWDDNNDWDEAWEQGILRAAERRGFKIALLDERAQFHYDFDKYQNRLTLALGRFKDSPAYLHIDGKPAVYLYQIPGKDTLTPDKFETLKAHVESAHGPVYWIVDKIAHDHAAANAGREDEVKRIPAEWLRTPGVDCFGFYGTFSNFRAHRYEELVGKFSYMTALAHAAGKKMLLPVHPGHDNSHFRDDYYRMPRRDGETLKDFLRAAQEACADIIMVTSWNEWPETTTIEPASTWEDPYLYLKILAEWRGIQFEVPELPDLASP